MTKITSAFAAALIASASFATAALAEGDYYQGVNEPSAGQQVPVLHKDRGSVSYGFTGSVASANGQADGLSNGQAIVNSGDYYQGANRPN